jgi:anti-sigma regulatory factor (Ser/Thr protein kinase)
MEMDEIDLRLASAPESVAAARRAVVGLDDLAVSERADASLLVSEVVTNSVRHAGMDETEEILLHARVERETLRVEVTDPGAGFERRPPEPRLESEDPGGWGLVLVDRLADRWGVERGAGTCVWFELDLGARRRSVAAA